MIFRKTFTVFDIQIGMNSGFVPQVAAVPETCVAHRGRSVRACTDRRKTAVLLFMLYRSNALNRVANYHRLVPPAESRKLSSSAVNREGPQQEVEVRLGP